MNKAILMGRLTKDPEVRYSQNNLQITHFTLAVDRRFTRQGEEKQADFFPVVTFGKTAEFCEKYYRKGQQVLVVGRIQTRTWDDNEGKRHYITEIVCEEAYFADTKRQDGGAGGRPDDFGYFPPVQPDGMDSPYGMGAQAYGGGQQRAPGGPPDRSGGRYTGSPGSAAQGADNGDQRAPDEDGFMPIENESDLPF